jgi:tRNA(Met) cytidine acetyltransferase
MTPVEKFSLWFNGYAQQALVKNERRLIILSGEELWALSLIESIDGLSSADSNDESPQLTLVTNESCFVYGDSNIFSANIQKTRYSDKLGSESEFIIFADSLFTIDAFAALSGTLKAGGIFFLVMPSLSETCEKSLFLMRLYSLIESMPNHVVITEEDALCLPVIDEMSVVGEVGNNKKTVLASGDFLLNCVTQEQYDAVKTINKVVSGHRKRPLVLTADRGRGKSSALAIACAQLLKEHQHHDFSIIITAPDFQSLSIFYRQLNQSLIGSERQGNKVTYGQASLCFMPVDQLIKQPVKINLLLVDEAAAIPVYLLENLLSHYHRIVFSSTVHGYEGAGRGFTLKFQKVLDNVCPQWTNLHINQPIRWRQNDPLEQLIFESCLLNAELPLLHESDVGGITTVNSLSSAVCKVITAIDLVADETLLKNVFAILVTAHYQTKPSDLQLLLDNPQVQLVCLFSSTGINADILAVTLLMNEGANQGVSTLDINAVKNSKRRLRNHFLPQSLLSHCGVEQAFDYQYLRIMRIAVHPQLQQQGIGLHFLKEIEALAIKQGADFIGTSFGVNQSLLTFWLKSGLTMARIGFTKDKASGEHSALLLKAMNRKANDLQKSLEREFYRSFDYLLLEEYKTLTTQVVALLLGQQVRASLVALSPLDIANVQAYVKGERQYSSCAYSLYIWLKHDLLSYEKYTNSAMKKQTLILIARFIQKHKSEEVCQQYGLTGKKMLNKHIQSYVSSRLIKDDV